MATQNNTNSHASNSSQADLQLLEKVFLRIALAESDDKLEASLHNLLAPTLLKLASRDEEVKNKILELLMHVNKRLNSRAKVGLPLEALISQYKNEEVPSIVWNFTIIYLKMAYQRAEKSVQISLIPTMLSCLVKRPRHHQNIILQNVLHHLNDLKYPEDITRRDELFSFLKDTEIYKFLLEYFTDFLLLPYNLSVDFKDQSVTPPSSLSRNIVMKLKGEQIMAPEQVEMAKLGILKFLASGLVAAEDNFALLIIASSDTKSSVADSAAHALKRFSSPEMLERTDIINKLLRLYQGPPSKPGNITVQYVEPDDIRSPSSLRLKLKIYPYFLKSRLIVDYKPAICLQIIFGGLFGEDLNIKIRHYSFEFVHHITLNSSAKTLNFMAPLFYQASSRVAFDKKEDEKLRSLAFGAFSKLSKRAPDLFKKDIALAQKLFSLLEEELPSTRLLIQECLSSISNAFYQAEGVNRKMVEALVVNNVEKELPHLRLASIQFAINSFPTTHIPSRYACILCAGDQKDDIREAALKGLSPSKRKESKQKTFYPNYLDMCNFLFEKMLERKERLKEEFPFRLAVYEKMLIYLMECLYAKCSVTEQDHINNTVLNKLSPHIRSIVHEEEISDISKTVIGRHFKLLKWALNPLTGYSIHVIALSHILQLICSYTEKLSLLFADDIDWFETYLFSTKDDVRELSARLIGITSMLLSNSKLFSYLDTLFGKLKSDKFEEVHGSMLGIGYILAYYVRCQRELQGKEDMTTDAKETLIDYVKRFLIVVLNHLEDSNLLIIQACCTAFGEIGRWFTFSDGEQGFGSVEKIIKKLCLLVNDAPETKIKERAASTLGSILISNMDTELRQHVIDALIQSSKIRHLELHFTIGEAFSCIGAGNISDLAFDKWTIKHEKQIFVDPNKDYMVSLLKRIIKECIYNNVSYVRQAGVVWLLCIVKYSSKHLAIQTHLREIQSAFIDLLSESDEVTQDVASRGLGLIYQAVKEEDRQEVVELLVDRLTTGKRKKIAFADDSEVFAEGTLGASPDGGKLSTYKELCSLATSMNKPDLMYKFMNLANHNAIWNSRKGAAFGFLSIASITGDQIKSFLPEIIPRLYRYQYDTNPSIQRAMTNIWSALVPDGKKTVDKYTKEILKDLLSNITSHLWRVRESCCLALNDLVRSCDPEDVIAELPNLWSITFKVMDDIKESVRKAATMLVKTLSRISIRFCDVNESRIGEKAVKEVLPVLLEIGLSSPVSEVKSISLQTLVKVAKNAGSLLKPHMATFVGALLESLSELEPQYLNTLSLQLSQSQEAQDKLDLIRISASKSSPMMEALNLCVQYVDNDVLNSLVPKLCEAIKGGIGLGTKVGASTFIVSLTLQCKEVLQPYCGKLQGALLNGMTNRNVAIKKAYANTIGHLIRYAKEGSIEKLIDKISKWYLEKEDESMHLACAYCMNSMMLYSPDTAYHYHSMILPLVFVAKHDEEKGTSESTNKKDSLQTLWQEIWDNHTTGESSAIKLYLSDIITMVTPLLTNQSWGLRRKAARSIVTIADKLGTDLQSPHLSNLLNPLISSLKGRTWEGKELLLKALTEVTVRCRTNIEKDETAYFDQIFDAVLKECRKEKVAYKLSAIECNSDIVGEWKINKFDEMKPIFETLLKSQDDEINEEEDRTEVLKKQNETICKTCLALSKVWPFDSGAQDNHFPYVISVYNRYLTQSTWKVQLAVLQSLVNLTGRINWQDALLVWKSMEEVKLFVTNVMPQVLTCIETSTYASVKLHSVKLIKCFYQQAKASACALYLPICMKFMKPCRTEIEILLALQQDVRTYADTPELRLLLQPTEGNMKRILKDLSSSTNFDITTNISELSKIMNDIGSTEN